MEDRTFMRLGAGSAVIGAVIFAVANIIHPRSEHIDVAIEQVQAVAAADTYILGHLLLLLGPILMVFGLVALQRSITKKRGAGFALYGFVAALISTGHLAALVGIDGRPTKVIADTFVAAPPEDAHTLMLIAGAIEQVNFGTLSVWIILFFGITYILYGLAVSASDIYPKWLGWAAVVMGAVQFLVGIVVTLNGPSQLMITNIFSPVAFLETLWLLVMGVLMWRNAPISKAA